MSTVFYYTSSGGFKRLVAPPSADFDEEWEFAEEIWDRLEERRQSTLGVGVRRPPPPPPLQRMSTCDGGVI